MKEFSTLPISPEPELHRKMQFSFILGTPTQRFRGDLQGIQEVYFKPHRPGTVLVLEYSPKQYYVRSAFTSSSLYSFIKEFNFC